MLREQLGPVNPLAKAEYDEALAYVEELETQREDLETALRELKSVIRETDKQIRETFEATFNAAAKNFEELAEHLFPGGRGRLRLVREDSGPRPVLGGEEEQAAAAADAAEEAADAEEKPDEDEDLMGVEIEITPAGKSMKRLTLLSGGEKSMTAIAFLFSVFLARPCPFYILDEVEAALDDANIGRFLELLRRYSDRAQFIVVTHQKRTMEAADTLYGVSMGNDGVSKVVSRRLPREEPQAPKPRPDGQARRGARGRSAERPAPAPDAAAPRRTRRGAAPTPSRARRRRTRPSDDRATGREARVYDPRLREVIAYADEADMLYHLFRWTLLQGKVPTARDWLPREDMPHPDAVAEVFGSWQKFLDHSGLAESPMLARLRALEERERDLDAREQQVEREQQRAGDLRRQLETARRKREEAESERAEEARRAQAAERALAEARGARGRAPRPGCRSAARPPRRPPPAPARRWGRSGSPRTRPRWPSSRRSARTATS